MPQTRQEAVLVEQLPADDVDLRQRPLLLRRSSHIAKSTRYGMKSRAPFSPANRDFPTTQLGGGHPLTPQSC